MIESEFITWEAPDGDHPVRRLSQRSYDLVSRKQKDEWLTLWAEDAVVEDPVGPSFFDPEGKGHHGHEGIAAFWKLAIEPIEKFEFEIYESFANPGGNTCANIGRIKTSFPDGSYTTTELIMVYVIHDDGRVASMKAFWEPERTMASFTKV